MLQFHKHPHSKIYKHTVKKIIEPYAMSNWVEHQTNRISYVLIGPSILQVDQQMEELRQEVTETIVPGVKLEPGSSNTTPKTATTLANLIGNVSLFPFLLLQFPANEVPT